MVGVFRRGVGYIQFGSFEARAARCARPQTRLERATHDERALRRIRRRARHDHFLDLRHEARRIGHVGNRSQEELRRDDAVGKPGCEQIVADRAVQHQQRPSESIAVLDPVLRRALDKPPKLAAADQVLRPTVGVGQPAGGVAPRQRGFEQFERPVPSLSALPDGVPGDELGGSDAGLSAASAFHHALHRFERVVVHRVGAAHADHEGLLDIRVARYLDVG